MKVGHARMGVVHKRRHERLKVSQTEDEMNPWDHGPPKKLPSGRAVDPKKKRNVSQFIL